MFILNNEHAFNTVFAYYFDMHNSNIKNKKNNLDYMGVTYLISDLKDIKGANGHLEIFKDNEWKHYNAKIMDIDFDIENKNFYNITLKVKENNIISEHNFIIDKFEVHSNLKRYYINLGTSDEVTIRIIEEK